MTADGTNADLLGDALDRHARPLTETPTPAGRDTPTVFLWPAKRAKPADAPDRPGAPDVHAVLASLDDVVWSASPTGETVSFLAGGVARTFGRQAGEFLSRPGLWLDAIPGDDRVAFRTALGRLPLTAQFTLEHRVATPAGATRWVVTRARLVRDPAGQPARVDGITTDVTARTRTERAGLAVLEAIGPVTGPAFLGRVVEQLATAFDARAAVIAVPDPGDPHTARAVAAWLDGRPADGFAFPAHGGFVRDVLAGGSQFVPAAARDRFPADEFLNRLRAETAAAVPLADEAGLLLGFVAVVDDRSVRGDAADARAVLRALAPRVAAELARPAGGSAGSRGPATGIASRDRAGAARATQLEDPSRLELLGRLVAGVAHDFNNLLGVISGHADLLRELLPPADPLREPVEQIVATGLTAAQVTRQLLALARPGAAPDPAVLDPNAAVRAAERTLRRLADGARLDVFLAPGVAPVRVDAGQFDQVLLNLVANARDALAGAGVITLRTAVATESADRAAWPADCPPGEYVALTVTDTGCGMTDEVKAAAFTRFFTTKGPNGTGLGLATVRDIVRGAGGHVEVDTAPGWGTTVRVFWPAADLPREPAPAPPPGEPALRVLGR